MTVSPGRHREHEAQAPGPDEPDLLHGREDRVGVDRNGEVGGGGGQPAAAQELEDPGEDLVGQQPAGCRDARLDDHPEGHRLAVQERPVARRGLQRMADGVPEVQRAAQVGLIGVARDELGLDRGSADDEPAQRVVVAGQQRVGAALDEGQVLR